MLILKKTDVWAIFDRLSAQNPNPVGELYYTNAFTLLVAVVLSAQATDKGVNKATQNLFDVVRTPADLVAMGLETLQFHIQSIGLYKTKARHLIALADRLITVFGGVVPQNRADLESLPGVGRKTANVVLNTAFGVETIAVDTHLFRLSHRLGLSQGKTPLAVERDLMAIIPPDFRRHAHHWLILHGRYVCKARAPLCATCILNDLCPWVQSAGKRNG